MKIIALNIPQYKVNTEPDENAIGKIVDDELRHQFMGQSLVIRGIASSEHSDKTLDELVSTIAQTGSDRYDPKRIGDRYENIEGKHIDFFGIPTTVTNDNKVFSSLVWGFYHSAIAVHGYPVRIDIVIIYGADSLEQISHQYEGHDDVKNDGFAFKRPNDKAASVLGIIKII